MMSRNRKNGSSREAYPARIFSKSPLTCPSCHATLREAVEHCPYCKFTGQDCVERFPFTPPPMQLFIDPSSHLSESDRYELSTMTADLAKKFPQVGFCFCIVEAEEKADLRELGFWLMNACPVDDEKETEVRPWTVLLVIDDANGRVSVTMGYAIEPFLEDAAWTKLLESQREYYRARDYLPAISRFLDGAETILAEGAARAIKNLKVKRKR